MSCSSRSVYGLIVWLRVSAISEPSPVCRGATWQAVQRMVSNTLAPAVTCSGSTSRYESGDTPFSPLRREVGKGAARAEKYQNQPISYRSVSPLSLSLRHSGIGRKADAAR